MATTGILRSRRSAAQLHAIASVEREIRSLDPATGRKYLRDFRDAYCSYQKVLAASDVRREVAKAGIVLVVPGLGPGAGSGRRARVPAYRGGERCPFGSSQPWPGAAAAGAA